MPQATVIKATLVAALAGFLFGYDTGVISGSQLYFTEFFTLNPSQQGWAVSSALYGCFAGAIISGLSNQAFGRKHSLILSACLFFISAWGSGIAQSLDQLAIYRIIGGIGVGLASMTAPMYIAEISPAAHRGRMVSIYQLAVVLGFFLVFVCTYFIGNHGADQNLHQYNVEQGWRVMLWSEMLPAGLFLGLLFFVPKSPRWLLQQQRHDEAKSTLLALCNNEELAERQFHEIQQSLQTQQQSQFSLLFTKPIFKLLLIGIFLSVFQQITGINAILYYGAEIFSNALNYGPEDALKQQLWLGAVNLLFTFVAIFTVDSWGRRPLLIAGTIGMLLALSLMAWSLFFNTLGIQSLFAILAFIASFALSMGPVVWVLLSEIFPNAVRSYALAIAVAAQWLFNAIVAQAFPVINSSGLNKNLFNGSLSYVLFAAFCVMALIFIIRWVPETKGKSLEDLSR